jgi:hypothetical protein
MTLQEKQAPIDSNLVAALVAATPEKWNSAEMFVERSDDSTNEKMSISISSPDGHKELVSPTDDIYEGLYKLSDCFRDEGKVWKSVRYRVDLAPDGNWRYHVNFDYPDISVV